MASPPADVEPPVSRDPDDEQFRVSLILITPWDDWRVVPWKGS